MFRGTETTLRIEVSENLTVLMPGRDEGHDVQTMSMPDAQTLSEFMLGRLHLPASWGFEQREPFMLRSPNTSMRAIEPMAGQSEEAKDGSVS